MPAVSYNQPVTVLITDLDTDVKEVVIAARNASLPLEVVYMSNAGGEFAGFGQKGTKYDGLTRAVYGTGFSYTFAREGGWVGTSLNLIIHAVDATGNLTVYNLTYEVTQPAAPEEEEQLTLEQQAASNNATAPIDMLLDQDGDLDLSTGALLFSSGITGVAQSINLRLKLIKGEWFLDEDDGTDYFGQIFVKNPDILAVREMLRARIIGAPYMKSLDDLVLDLNKSTREAEIDWQGSADFGPIEGTTEV